MPPPSLAPTHTPPPHAAWPGLLSTGDIFHNFLGHLNFPFPLGDCLLLLAGCCPFPAETPSGAVPCVLGTNLICGVTRLF